MVKLPAFVIEFPPFFAGDFAGAFAARAAGFSRQSMQAFGVQFGYFLRTLSPIENSVPQRSQVNIAAQRIGGGGCVRPVANGVHCRTNVRVGGPHVTLRMELLAGGLAALVERHRQRAAALDAALAAANDAARAWADDPAGGDARIHAAMANNPAPYATTFGEPPTATFAIPPFAPCTVVAADGSSIDPDRFAPVPCFVINTGWAVLPYRVGGEAALGSKPWVGPREAASDSGEDDGGDASPGGRGWGVSLLRDIEERETGIHLARERLAHGPVVLLFDGTFLPWDLDSPRIAARVRKQVMRRLLDALALLATGDEPISAGAYISGSRSGDVATSLAVLAGQDPEHWLDADSLFFAALLGEGERSALFRARSQRGQTVEQQVPPESQVAFFYLRTGGDVARVELPIWAATPDRVARLHATLIDQCARCDGYPRALQEAHEQAVISGGDRQQFARLLETEAARQRVFAALNGKQSSKRRRAV